MYYLTLIFWKLSSKTAILVYSALLLLSLCTAFSQPNKIEDVAKKDLHVREVGKDNEGFNDKVFQRELEKLGWKKYLKWCSFTVSKWRKSSSAKEPNIVSGLARKFKTKKSISIQKVVREKMELPPGTIIIFARGNTIYGHVGIVLYWKGGAGITLEGNYNNRVSIVERKYNPAARQRILCFTLVEYGDGTTNYD